MGTGRYLKERNPNIRIIAVEPDDALHGLEGLKHMASSIVPGFTTKMNWMRRYPVSTEDAYAMVYRLSQERKFSWQFSAAALFATLKLARKLRESNSSHGIPHFGEKYL